MGSRMGVMEAAEARGSITPEVITFVSNKRLATAAGIVKEIIVTPIAIIIGAVIAVIITVVIHRSIYAGARGQCEQRRGAQDHFQFIVHDEPLAPALPDQVRLRHGIRPCHLRKLLVGAEFAPPIPERTIRRTLLGLPKFMAETPGVFICNTLHGPRHTL